MTEQKDQVAFKRVRAGRLKMILIVSLFLIPMAGSWLLLQKAEQKGPWGTSNKGELIIPVRPLQNFSLGLSNNPGRYTLESMLGNWTLVYFVHNTCNELCKQNIYYLRQIRAALGKDMQRVEPLLVLQDNPLVTELDAFLQSYPELAVAVGNESEVEDLLKQFGIDNQHDNPHIFLVDPLGNLMMSYSYGFDPANILKDLRKLLKISRIG